MSRQTFFVSDMHFGHKNIIEYCNRPYVTVDGMNNDLILKWNKTVNKEDLVYHLGDWAFNDYWCIGELNGTIISIPGNHDHERKKKLDPFVTLEQNEILYLKITPEIRFVLCHYPLDAWRREYKYHLHGHNHGMTGVKTNRLDVGIDASKLYRPMHIDEVMDKMKLNNLWAEEMKQ